MMLRTLASWGIKPRLTCGILWRKGPHTAALRRPIFSGDVDVLPYRLTQSVAACRYISNTCPSYQERVAAEESATEKDQQHQDQNQIELEKARIEVGELRAIGWQAPENISDADAEHYLTLTTKKSRKKFLRFLSKKELLKRSEKMKKQERARERELLKEKNAADKDGDGDDIFPNRLFLRIHNTTMLQFDKWRLASGMKFGSEFVFDFSYEEMMKRQEVISLIQQLMHAINANKHAKEPFNVHWVGLDNHSQTSKEMRRIFGESLENTMVNITDNDLLDTFPRDKLVYMSADSPNVLQSFDPDKVYVVGALVDSHTILTGQSLARAKRYGLDHARLPLDKHLQWTTGGKALTIDQMMKIMIEINDSGDWTKALQHVPIRKHSGLRSGPHWDHQGALDAESKKRRRSDSIQRNPSHFVSSRARESGDGRSKSSSKSSRTWKPASHAKNWKDVKEDDTNSTFFAPRGKSKNVWFDDDN